MHAGNNYKGTACCALRKIKRDFQKVAVGSIPVIVRSFKATVSRWCNRNNLNDFKWQRGYNDSKIFMLGLLW